MALVLVCIFLRLSSFPLPALLSVIDIVIDVYHWDPLGLWRTGRPNVEYSNHIRAGEKSSVRQT